VQERVPRRRCHSVLPPSILNPDFALWIYLLLPLSDSFFFKVFCFVFRLHDTL